MAIFKIGEGNLHISNSGWRLHDEPHDGVAAMKKI
jgi:hypothetical protein